MFAAVVFTALSLGRISSLAPDAAKSKLAAARIMGLLNRKPTMDVVGSDGLKLVHLYLHIFIYL